MLKNERTLKDDVEILKAKLAVVTEDIVAQSKKFSDEDHLKECKKLEVKIDELKKTISNMKQVLSIRNIDNMLTRPLIVQKHTLQNC